MTSIEYLQHMTSGEIWAVEWDAHQNVIASVGPLNYRDIVSPASAGAWQMTTEDNEWFAEHEADFRLLDGAELDQKIARWAESNQ